MTGYDYQDAMNTVAAANSMFEGLPSAIRNQFDNDPAKFINFVDDEANADKLVEMGLVKPKVSTPVDEGSEEPVEAVKTAETEVKTEG
jgi:phage internal scaffolding protein